MYLKIIYKHYQNLLLNPPKLLFGKCTFYDFQQLLYFHDSSNFVRVSGPFF